MVLDQLRLLVWQRTKDGAKNRKQPKPLSPLAQAKAKSQRFGDNGGRSKDEIKAMLAKFGPRRRQ